MCGICGILSCGELAAERVHVEGMCQALAHRGPDDSDVYIRDTRNRRGGEMRIALGHRRLSIIDLSASGRQPMCNEDGTVWLVFNGEIYNFRQLRAELLAKGHVFRSETDTEVILHLYEEEGVDSVRRLVGMFAFALWDAREKRLWLCRDRLGIKPLVYFQSGADLAFASEIKSLLTLRDIPKALDRRALELYLAFNYVPAPLTMIRGIRKLPPAHSLVFENGCASLKKYWRVPRSRARKSDPATYSRRMAFNKKRLYKAMEEAVVSRMIADVPLGAFLSGGIDSGIVTALMARNSDRPIKTFSIGFKDPCLLDETRYSREMARMYRTDHHEFRIAGTDMLDVLENVLDSFDEPFADSSAIPTYIVSMHSRKHVSVVLSGDGGDELFGGYRSYLGEYWHPAYMRLPGTFRDWFERTVRNLPDSRDDRLLEYARRLKKFAGAMNGSDSERLYGLKRVFPDSLSSALLCNPGDTATEDDASAGLSWVKCLVDRYGGGDRINRMLYTDLVDSLPGDMLQKVDLMSMRHALEVRTPILDHRVVELAFHMSGDLKIKGFKTKHVLKETFRDILPPSLLKRAKAGFEIPIGQWLKNDLKSLIFHYLSKKRIETQQIFRYETVRRLVSDLFDNRTDTSWMLWNLIVFQYWYDRYYE